MSSSEAAGCTLCPRSCRAPRTQGRYGYCHAPREALVCRAAPHYGEEPCLSGTRGSGAVFFSGCALGCVFCQNRRISRSPVGTPADAGRLRELFYGLREQGVHNINLVTASHAVPVVVEALSGAELGIPVVWNSSGYESVETLRRLEGLVQVYLPDFKYADSALAERYSHAPDYPEVALAAVREMYRQTGAFQTDGEGLLRRGVMVRHLVLPGAAENTLRVIDAIEDNFPAAGILFSLMGQYTPMPGLEAYPELCRPVSPAEYERCKSYLEFSALQNGFYQELDSAGEEMIPEFDLRPYPFRCTVEKVKKIW